LVNQRIQEMTRQAIIERTLKAINQLPPEKAVEISDFAEFLSQRFDEQKLTERIQEHTANSASFEFLNNEEDLYTVEDLKEVYNAKR